MVQLPRYLRQLLADLAPAHLLLCARGVAVRQGVARVLRVEAGVLEDAALGGGQALAKVNQSVAQLRSSLDATLEN